MTNSLRKVHGNIFLSNTKLFPYFQDLSGKMDPLETPLHKSVKAGNIPDVKALILNGVDINAKDNLNKSPLYYAVLQKKASIVNTLLQNGADPNTKDSTLVTPLLKLIMVEHRCILPQVLPQDMPN